MSFTGNYRIADKVIEVTSLYSRFIIKILPIVKTTNYLPIQLQILTSIYFLNSNFHIVELNFHVFGLLFLIFS